MENGLNLFLINPIGISSLDTPQSDQVSTWPRSEDDQRNIGITDKYHRSADSILFVLIWQMFWLDMSDAWQVGEIEWG